MALLPLATFADVVRAVVASGVDYGALPLHTVIAGRVTPVRDALDSADVEPLRELDVPIHLALLGLPDSSAAQIREVLGHPVALGQCTQWRATHPRIRVVEAPDTAAAARMIAVRRDRHAAVIAGPWAAAHYGLTILAQHLEDRVDDTTRYVVFRRRPPT